MDFSRFKRENPNKDWLDWWLSDDPASPAVKAEIRQAKVAQANRYQPRGSTPVRPLSQHQPLEPPDAGLPSVTINISVPKIKLPKPKKIVPKIKPPAIPYRRIALSLVVLAALSLASLGAYHWHRSSADAQAGKTTNGVPDRSGVNIPLSFTPVAPKSQPQLASLGGDKTAYDKTRGTYSFVDSFNGTQLTVSEQAIPANLGTPDQAVASVASSAGAKDTVSTNAGTAYINTQKSGNQVIIFSQNNLLIFIQSAFTHSSAEWKSYIDSLQ